MTSIINCTTNTKPKIWIFEVSQKTLKI